MAMESLWNLAQRRAILLTALLYLITLGSCLSTRRSSRDLSSTSAHLHKRSITPTVVCKRWAQQSAAVNGTIWLYGGRAIMDSTQTANSWTNDFLTLNLTTSWQISAPAYTGLPRPSGPPQVADGYLWASYDSLYLYGGEVSDNPITSPVPFALWQYDIESAQWTEHSDPTTSAGVNSLDTGSTVNRAAEGAGFSVAALGRGWYFGGHEDQYTMPSWTYLNGRVYLQSLLEYTFPGYNNPEVQTLSGGAVAGFDGVWRNITQAALANDAGFPERADGIIVWVPGFGEQGILIGVGGGTSDSFTETNIIDVYDVARSAWYKQATSGPVPKPRVDPCAVVAAAADGSSYNIYMYGGQDLLPAGQQTQYSDIWILSLPTFTWIPVSQDGQSRPPARSGHTCNVWDAQMVVVGGYVGTSLLCDSPGTYVFDLSAAQWVNEFMPTSNPATNPQSKQTAQLDDPLALQGSFGYAVPRAVQEAIGGGPSGGATATTPAATATSGPIATGRPKHYKLPPGAKSGTSGGENGGGDSGNTANGSSSSGTNVGAIAAGVVAGVLLLALLYLAFVTWLYRKRLAEYKRNIDNLGGKTSREARRRARARRARAPANSGNGNGNGYGYGEYDYDALAVADSARSSSPDSLAGREPTFVGIMLSPRRSLRVTNPDLE